MIDWNYNLEEAPKDGTRVLLALKGSSPGDIVNGPSAHTGMWIDAGTGIGYCWQPNKYGPIMFLNVYAWAPLNVPPLPQPENVIHLSVSKTEKSDFLLRSKEND